MKLLLCAIIIGAASAARLDNTYLPPGNAKTAGGSGDFLASPVGGADQNGGGAIRNGGVSQEYGAPVAGISQFNNGVNIPSLQKSRPSTFEAPRPEYGAPAAQYSNGNPAHQSGAPEIHRSSNVPQQLYGVPVATGGRNQVNGHGVLPARKTNAQPLNAAYGAPVSGRNNGPSSSYGAPNGNSGHANGRDSYSGSAAAPINIIRYNNENNGDGSYKFEYETENHITQQEVGELRNGGTDQESTVVQGSYSYISPEGQTYTVNYIADENGFQPTGDHIHSAIQMAAAEAALSSKSGDFAGYPTNGQPTNGQANTGKSGYQY